MAQYANLKDYFQNKHNELIQEAISNHINDGRRVIESIVRSLVCTNDDAEYNAEFEIGVSVKVTGTEKNTSYSYIVTVRGNLEQRFKDIQIKGVRRVTSDMFPEDNILSQFILPYIPRESVEDIGNGIYKAFTKNGIFYGCKINIDYLVETRTLCISPLNDNCLGRIILAKSDVEIMRYEQTKQEKILKKEKIHAEPGTILLNYKKYVEEGDGRMRVTIAHELIHLRYHSRFLKVLLLLGEEKVDLYSSTEPITLTDNKTDWMMMQVVQRAKAGDVVVVLDPTNAFCKEELTGHQMPEEIIDNYFTFWDMSTQGWPVNILDFEGCVDFEQKVKRLSSLLISGMHSTGENQKAIVMTKVEGWLSEYEKNNSLSIYSLWARFDENAEERKLQTKLNALLSTVKDMKNEVQPPGWSNLLSEQGKVIVISVGNATINVDANPFDILIDTLYSFKDKNRDSQMTVVLDEVQMLNHRKDSTLVHILSRVRKLDISVILASQDYLNRSLSAVYKYCGTHILFRPLGEECIKAVAELTKLDINVIRTLPNFCCAIMGSIYSKYNQMNIQLESAVIGETYRPPYVGNY